MIHYHDIFHDCYFCGLFHGSLFAATAIFSIAVSFGIARNIRSSQGRCGITARAFDPFGQEHVKHGFYTQHEADAWEYQIRHGEQLF